MGRLTGVVDDRGKFIHVERGEMEKVWRGWKRVGVCLCLSVSMYVYVWNKRVGVCVCLCMCTLTYRSSVCLCGLYYA